MSDTPLNRTNGIQPSTVYRETSYQVFDIVAVLKNVVTIIRPLVRDRPIAVEFVTDVESLLIVSDCLKVEQITVNLLRNAVRTTKRGRIALILGVEGPWLKLTVTDTGTGIEQRVLNGLFISRDRQEEVKTSRPFGTGFGLLMAKALLELLSGTIVVSSQSGAGTICEALLPLETAERREVTYVSI
jgi:signal transduction histidine kinase